MIDIHSHILFDVDDGSRNIETSIKMAKEAKAAGFDTICVTPHYLEPSFVNDKKNNDVVLGKLKTELVKQGIDINLILGNEIYITTNILELLEYEKVSKIGESDYILIEFPMNQELKYVKDILIELLSKKIKIIVAHPERYSYVQKDISYLEQFLDMGIIFQSNYASLIGRYGKEAEKTVKKLLKNKMIQCMATDAHRDNSIYFKMNIILKKLRKIVNNDYYNLLVNENQKHILNNEDVVILEYEKVHKFRLFK